MQILSGFFYHAHLPNFLSMPHLKLYNVEFFSLVKLREGLDKILKFHCFATHFTSIIYKRGGGGGGGKSMCFLKAVFKTNLRITVSRLTMGVLLKIVSTIDHFFTTQATKQVLTLKSMFLFILKQRRLKILAHGFQIRGIRFFRQIVICSKLSLVEQYIGFFLV